MSNIQVVVRCRGRNSRETASKMPVVVTLADQRSSIVDPHITVSTPRFNSSTYSQNSKTYTVDQVYGPEADQSLIFENVALPLFKKFIDGSNVSMLAYGQTGTGKTYTMCGEHIMELSIHAGIIPRVLRKLFMHLENAQFKDFLVKCSYIELYNEELRDLLSDDDKIKLRVFESKASPLGVNIQNLKEVHIAESDQGFKMLKGVQKRQTAFTKMNDSSSRSHTIFSIILYKKVNQEHFKVSKMNLVDLAGSENINRSGSINQRAKEAGSINQSLLTLGRVINLLSDKSVNLNHVPYRESKLTRLLKDSLGGNTETALISTISPSKLDSEETISTLDYASKAKNIMNSTDVNQENDQVMKKVLVKDLSNKLIMLSQDLEATRKKNGMYMDENNYKNMLDDNAALRIDLKEAVEKIKTFEFRMRRLEEIEIQLEKEKLEHRKKTEELSSKMNFLEEENMRLKTNIDERDSSIKELKERTIKIQELNLLAAQQLTKTVNASLSNSMVKIENMERNPDGNGLFEIINEINNALNDSLEKLCGEIETKLEHSGKSFNVSATSLADELTLSAQVESIRSNISTMQLTLKEKLSELQKTHSTLDEYLKETHLDPTKLKTTAKILLQDLITNGAEQIRTKLGSQVECILRDTSAQYERLIHRSVADVIVKIIGDEKQDLQKYQDAMLTNANQVYRSVLEGIGISLEALAMQTAQVQENVIDKARQISGTLNSGVNNDLEGIKQEVKSGLDLFRSSQTQRLNSLSDKLTSNSSNVKESLLEIRSDLLNIQKSNNESCESYSHIYSPSKLSESDERGQNELTNVFSKKPPFLVAKTIEFDADRSKFKKRKVLEELHSDLNNRHI